jgi:hypothetical protein
MKGRKGKPDNQYRPKKRNPNLSEEEKDDFEDVIVDRASTANVSDHAHGFILSNFQSRSF